MFIHIDELQGGSQMIDVEREQASGGSSGKSTERKLQKNSTI